MIRYFEILLQKFTPQVIQNQTILLSALFTFSMFCGIIFCENYATLEKAERHAPNDITKGKTTK